MEESMSFRIITDSNADVPPKIIKEYDLFVMPTPVIVNGENKLDGQTIQPKELYDILRAGGESSTSQINSFMFEEYFREFAKAKEEVIYICFSSGLTGTYHSATMALETIKEEYPEFDMTIIDTKCASLGFGLVVYLALLMQKNGASKETVLEGIYYHSQHMQHIFTVDDLEYLFKGGRLSRTSALVGGLLDIKPIISTDEEGKLVAIDKVRGRNRSIKKCLEYVEKRGKNLDKQIVGVCHGDDIPTMNLIKDELNSRFGCTKFIENYVGCSIGTHTGPGMVAIVFLDEESKYQEYLKQ